MCLLPQDVPSLSRCPQSTGEASPTLGLRIQDLTEKRGQIMTKEPGREEDRQRAGSPGDPGTPPQVGHGPPQVGHGTPQFWVVKIRISIGKSIPLGGNGCCKGL